jgi:hypothetical protein
MLMITAIGRSASSQDYQSLFKGKTRVSGFGAIINEVSFGRNEHVGTFNSSGAEIAVLLNQQLYFGFFGLTSTAPYDISLNRLPERGFLFAQTGISTGYVIMPNKTLHFTTGIRAGYAHLQSIWYRQYPWNTYLGREFSPGLVFTPHINAEVNLFGWMKASVGAGYRKVFGDTRSNFPPPSALSQFSLQSSLIFGYFKGRKA